MCFICEKAKACINGDYGNGNARKDSLEAEGLCYYCVQNMVNFFVGEGFRYQHTIHESSDPDEPYCEIASKQCF